MWPGSGGAPRPVGLGSGGGAGPGGAASRPVSVLIPGYVRLSQSGAPSPSPLGGVVEYLVRECADLNECITVDAFQSGEGGMGRAWGSHWRGGGESGEMPGWDHHHGHVHDG